MKRAGFFFYDPTHGNIWALTKEQSKLNTLNLGEMDYMGTSFLAFSVFTLFGMQGWMMIMKDLLNEALKQEELALF